MAAYVYRVLDGWFSRWGEEIVRRDAEDLAQGCKRNDADR